MLGSSVLKNPFNDSYIVSDGRTGIYKRNPLSIKVNGILLL